jgi:hypothetical protein
MVCFQTKNPNLGKCWRALDWKMFLDFMAIWNILWRFGIYYDHLLHFVLILVHFSGFGIMYQEKSGNPGHPAASSADIEEAIRFHYLARWILETFCSSDAFKP